MEFIITSNVSESVTMEIIIGFLLITMIIGSLSGIYYFYIYRNIKNLKVRSRLINIYFTYNMFMIYSGKGENVVDYELIEHVSYNDMLYSFKNLDKPWLFLKDDGEFWMVQDVVLKLQNEGKIDMLCKALNKVQPQNYKNDIKKFKKVKPYKR